MWTGFCLVAVAGVLAAVFLVQRMSGTSSGLKLVLFSDEVRATQEKSPGVPSAVAASSVLLLSIAVWLTRLHASWVRVAWMVCLTGATALPAGTVLVHGVDASPLMDATWSTGQSVGSVVSLLLLVAATLAARPDRNPLAWLLARPDRWALVRLIAILAGLPTVVGTFRQLFFAVGVRLDAAWVLAVTLGTVAVGAATFYSSQREQRLLIQKEALSTERAEAETRYRILAENAVDVVLHLRGVEIVWISPSVEVTLGGPPEQWIGSDFLTHIHPDDLDDVITAF